MPASHAILFDLDGTLLNSLRDLAVSMNRTLDRLGLPPHPEEAYRFFVGDGMETLVRRVLPASLHGTPLEKACLDGMRTEYSRRWNETTRPYAGIPELLDTLGDRGIPMVIFSNKPDDFTRLIAARLLGRWRFAVVSGARPDMPKKPDPAGALQLAATIGLPPADFLYLGDTSTDMRCAVAAGMKAIGVAWGFRSPEELRTHGAMAVLGHPLELLEFIDHGTTTGNDEPGIR